MPQQVRSPRLQTTAIFLTYPRFITDTPLDTVLELLKDKLKNHAPSYDVVNYLLANELHADGTRHIHCYLKLNCRCSITNFSDFFVLQLNSDFRANVQPVRSPQKCKDYVAKGGEFITDFYVPKVKACDVLKAETREEFYELAAKANPLQFLYQQRGLDYTADKLFPSIKPSFSPSYELESFDYPTDLGAYLERTFDEPTWSDRPQSLVLCSPTRYGKTEFLRTYLHALELSSVYCAGLFSLDNFDTVARPDAIIFDDLDIVSFCKNASWKMFFGCQREFTLTDKYRKKITLRFGKGVPFIWLCNEENDPFYNCDIPLHVKQYLEHNCTHIILTKPLF